jgi:hypothetical protein
VIAIQGRATTDEFDIDLQTDMPWSERGLLVYDWFQLQPQTPKYANWRPDALR